MEKFKTKPYAHQLKCLTGYGRREYFALLAEMGTGKTFIVVNNMADLWASHDLDGALVFAPNGVHYNWTMIELPKHMPDYVRYRAAHWVSSPKKKDKEQLENLLGSNDSTELKILTMNWEALTTEKGFKAALKFATTCRRLMIVCDESQNIKNPSAQRTKALMKLKAASNYRRIMTGTMITNSPFDAFSQMAFLDEHILQTSSYYAFKAEYAEMVPADSRMMQNIMKKNGINRAPQIVARTPDGAPAYRNLDKLNKLIAPHAFRVLKSECLDLPKKIYKSVVFDMTAEQTRIYKKAVDECRLEFNNDDTAFSKIAMITKLAQITSGYYLHAESEEPVRIDGNNPKLDLLIDRCKALAGDGHKTIVWARFHVQIQDILAALDKEGIESVAYYGAVNKDDRLEALERFRNGSASVFVSQQQAGGTGITLVEAGFVIYFSNTFSYGDRLQSEDRAHRIGQDKEVTYVDLIARDSIDEVVVDNLQRKENISGAILAFGKYLENN